MLLSDMRKRVRVVMFIVAAAFIIGFLLVPNLGDMWNALTGRGRRGGLDTRGLVGQIGKHNITPEEYRGAVSYITDKYKTDNRLRDLSSEDYQAIEQQAWKYLISELTWSNALKAGKITVTQDEVLELIRANPPEELRSNPELMTDGKFDQEKYLQVMNLPENREYFTKYFRELVEMLPKEKYRIDLVSAYRVTGRETEDALSDANSRWLATSLFFGRRAVKQGDGPNEAEVRAWYEAHKDSFRTKEMRMLRYVFFPLTIARADSDAAKETIDRAYDQLVKGETFNLTVLDYSDHEGETLATMFPREKLDKLTDSIVSRLKPGQYSTPFLSSYGWQIALLDSIKQDSVAIRRILVRVKMGSEAVAVVRDSVRSFIEKAPAEKFDTLAARFGLAVRAARPLVGDKKELPGLDVQSPGQIIEWAKSARPGQVFDLPQRGGNGYYVFELKEVKPAGVPAFDSVKQAATYRMRQDRDRQSWLEAARQALAAVKAGKSFEQYAQENPAVELQTDTFNGIRDCRGKKGSEFAGALAALNPGDKYGVVEASWGAFIIRCDERTTAAALDPSAYADQRREQVAQDLMQELLKQPEVSDYRDALAY